MPIKILSTPLDHGKEIQVVRTAVTTASTETYEFSGDAEAVLVSLFVSSTAGDVDVKVLTEGATGQDVEVISFPTVSAPTTELLLRKSASILRKVRVRVTTTGAAEFEIRARGVSAGASSVSIQGASSWEITRTSVTAVAGVLISSSLQDRQGILVENISDVSGSTGLIWVAETLAKATSGAGHPVRSGGNIAVDLQGGSELYAVSDGGTVAVSIIETGE